MCFVCVCVCKYVCTVLGVTWTLARDRMDRVPPLLRHLPLTSSAAVYLAWAAGFWAWQVYRPVWCRVSLGMLSKLEYGSSVVTTTAAPPSPPLPVPVLAVAADDGSSPSSCSRTGAPSLSHAMLSGGSPWLTPHTTLVRVPSIRPSPGKLKGSITGGTNGKTKQNYKRVYMYTNIYVYDDIVGKQQQQ